MQIQERGWWQVIGVAAALAGLAGGCIDEVDAADEPATSEERAELWWDEGPRAAPAIPWDQMTALQRHVSYFDYDGDGYITVTEDYRGLRALGMDPVSASTFAFGINAALGTPTTGFPSLTVSIYDIDNGVHGSDTGIYDSQGRFVPQQFERLFSDWDRNGSGGLDLAELTARTIDDADLGDLFGVTASTAEFGLLYVLAAENGELTRERMRAFYDGTLFYVLAEERAGERWWGWWL